MTIEEIYRVYHKTNPLHVFCRLIGLGMNPKAALMVARIYEWTVFKAIKQILKKLVVTLVAFTLFGCAAVLPIEYCAKGMGGKYKVEVKYSKKF